MTGSVAYRPLTPLLKSTRLIMVHGCYEFLETEILSVFKPRDLIFFDDALYSQYIFYNQYKHHFTKLRVNFVLGLSTKFIRESDSKGIQDITSIKAHELAKNHNNYDSYMSIQEIYDFLSADNTFLALHGHSHKDLRNLLLKDQVSDFTKEVTLGVEALKKLDLYTTTYLFPYNYKPPFADTVLALKGLLLNLGAGRIAIEELL